MKHHSSRFRFSHRSIDALPTPPADYPSSNHEYSDEVETGLRLAVYRETGKRSFRYRYTYLGRKGVLTLGEYPAVTVDLARELVRENKRLLAQGIDPRAERTKAREVITFERFCLDHYMPYAKQTQRAYKDVENRLTLRLIPAFGKRSLDQIRRKDVADLHCKLLGEVSAVTANRYLSQIMAIYSKAIEWEYATDNPAKGIQKHPENGPRTRYLQKDELARFAAATWEEVENGDQSACAIFMFLVTGHRKTEVLSQRWEDIDLESRTGYLRDPLKKGKRRHFPLSSALVTMLEKMFQERTGNNPWLFPNKEGDGHQKDTRRTFRRICAKAGIVEDTRQHDLRRSFASRLASSGTSAMVIRDLLGHRDVRTTQQVYAHLDLGSLREASESISDEIVAALG